MKDADTTPYTIDILMPSIAAAAALAERHRQAAGGGAGDDRRELCAQRPAGEARHHRRRGELLGTHFDAGAGETAPSDQEVLAAIATCADDMKQVASRGSQPAAALAQALDRVVARDAAVLPALTANIAPGIEHRLDDIRLSLQAAPVTIASMPAVAQERMDRRGRASAHRGLPQGRCARQRGAAQLRGLGPRIAPDATGTPVTIQESARTVTHAFVIAGIIAFAAMSLLLALVLRQLHGRAAGAGPLLVAGLLALATSVLAGCRSISPTSSRCRCCSASASLSTSISSCAGAPGQRPAAIEHSAGDPVQRAHHRHRLWQPGAVDNFPGSPKWASCSAFRCATRCSARSSSSRRSSAMLCRQLPIRPRGGRSSGSLTRSMPRASTSARSLGSGEPPAPRPGDSALRGLPPCFIKHPNAKAAPCRAAEAIRRRSVRPAAPGAVHPRAAVAHPSIRGRSS